MAHRQEANGDIVPTSVGKLKNFFQNRNSGNDQTANVEATASPSKPIIPPKPKPTSVENSSDASVWHVPKPCIVEKPNRPPKPSPPPRMVKPSTPPKPDMTNRRNGPATITKCVTIETGSTDEANVEDQNASESQDKDREIKEDEDVDSVDGEDVGWGSDFGSESESEHEEAPCLDKRKSRIIFDELDGMPNLEFLDQKKRKLYNIAKEILTTEITYVQTLKLLNEVFFFQLDQECRAKAGNIPKEALLEIFSNVSSIHKFHQDFLLPKLEDRMKEWKDKPRVGDIFNYLAPFLKMYAEYVKNFDQAMTSLAKWKLKSQKLSSIIDNIQKTPECGNLTLEHHMLAVVQRVPRYKLLLSDYISKLTEDSSDLLESKKALEIISSAATHANESMKKTERFKKMLEMQEKFSEEQSIVTPSREFIMEGEFVKIAKRDGQPKPRVLVLFNDTIYYCSRVSATGKYKVHNIAELLYSRVEETREGAAENKELMFRVRSKQDVTDLVASSLAEKDRWVQALTDAIEKAVDRNSTFGREGNDVLNEDEIGKRAPVWIKDLDVSMCMDCTMAFTTLKRRHHCRACGKIFCNACSSYKVPLEYKDNKVDRVCFTCYKIVNKGEGDLTEKKASKGFRRRSSKKALHADSLLNCHFNVRTDQNKTWSKRWCSLGVDFTVYVFRRIEDVKTECTIPLPGFTVEIDKSAESTGKNGNHVLKVFHPMFGTYLFEADSEELLQKWFRYVTYATKAEQPPECLPDTTTAAT